MIQRRHRRADEPSGEFNAPLAIHVHFSEDQCPAVVLLPLYLLNNVKNLFLDVTLRLSSAIDLKDSLYIVMYIYNIIIYIVTCF